MDFVLRHIPIVGFLVFFPVFGCMVAVNRIIREKKPLTSVAIQSIRIALGLILLLAGHEKLGGLTDIIGPNYLIPKLEEYHLGLFGSFIAFSQVVIGFVLLTNRLGALGDIMAFPMFLNIYVVTLSLQWKGTPKEVLLFLIMNVILIFSNWHKIKFLITDDTSAIRDIPIKRENIKLDFAYAFILACMLLSLSLLGNDNAGIQRMEKVFFVSLLVVFVVAIYYKTRNRPQD